VANDRFGSSLTAWNFGRNQPVNFPLFNPPTADLAIGIPGKDVRVNLIEGEQIFTDAGGVRVIYGSTGGLSITTGVAGAVGPSQLWSQGAPAVVGGVLGINPGVPGVLESGDAFGSALY
jgi:hypothetical protein